MGAPEATGAEGEVIDMGGREREDDVEEERESVEGVGRLEEEPERKKMKAVTSKREREGYSGYTDIVLKREMKKKRYKLSERSREEIITLLEEDDRMQKVIRWAAPQMEHQGQANFPGRGEWEDGGREGDTVQIQRDREEDLWKDVEPTKQGQMESEQMRETDKGSL